jgi:hypothetical protein
MLRNVQTVKVEEASLTHFQLGTSEWINQADCIDMDCDGVITLPASLFLCLLLLNGVVVCQLRICFSRKRSVRSMR